MATPPNAPADVIPAPRPDDTEDVSDALAIASTVWGRGEKDDAIGWIRRAATAAQDAGATARAIELQGSASALGNAVRFEAANLDHQEVSAEVFVMKTPQPTAVIAMPPIPAGAPVGSSALPPPLGAPSRSAPADSAASKAAAMPPRATGAAPAMEPKKPALGASVAAPRPQVRPSVMAPKPAATVARPGLSGTGNPGVRAPATDAKARPSIEATRAGVRSAAAGAPATVATVGGATQTRVPSSRPPALAMPVPAPETPSDSDVAISIALDVPTDLESTTQAPIVDFAAIRGGAGRTPTISAVETAPDEPLHADDRDIESLDDEAGDTVSRALSGEQRRLIDAAVAAETSRRQTAEAASVAASSEPSDLPLAVAVRVRIYTSEAGAWVVPEQPGDTDGVSALLVPLSPVADLRTLFPGRARGK